VFVVLEGTSVLGVATTRAGAEEIAERGSPGQWSEWRDGPNFTDRRRERDDRMLTQRIVRSPLAGSARWPGASGPINDMREFNGARLAGLGYGREIEAIGRDWGAP